jgi:hypothetical protein
MTYKSIPLTFSALYPHISRFYILKFLGPIPSVFSTVQSELLSIILGLSVKPLLFR